MDVDAILTLGVDVAGDMVPLLDDEDALAGCRCNMGEYGRCQSRSDYEVVVMVAIERISWSFCICHGFPFLARKKIFFVDLISSFLAL